MDYFLSLPRLDLAELQERADENLAANYVRRLLREIDASEPDLRAVFLGQKELSPLTIGLLAHTLGGPSSVVHGIGGLRIREDDLIRIESHDLRAHLQEKSWQSTWAPLWEFGRDDLPHFGSESEAEATRAFLHAQERLPTLHWDVADHQAWSVPRLRSVIDEWKKEDTEVIPLLRIGSFLAALSSACEAAIEKNLDVMCGSMLDGTLFHVVDIPATKAAISSHNLSYMQDRLAHARDREERKARLAAEKERSQMSSVDKLVLLAGPARLLELDDEQELFGHYLAHSLNFLLPVERQQGFEFLHELSPNDLSNLVALLESYGEAPTQKEAFDKTVEEFGYSEEMAGTVLSWFGTQERTGQMKKRQKLIKMAQTGLGGKGKLIYVHQEGE